MNATLKKIDSSWNCLLRYGKIAALLLFTLFLTTALSSNAQAAESLKGKKVLLTYYSHSGNTETLAKKLHALVGGDLMQIKSTTAYPGDTPQVKEQVKVEQANNFRPPLEALPYNAADYDVIFVAYPLWFGTLPGAYYTYLEATPMDAKVVIPLATRGGGPMEESIVNLKQLCPKATVITDGYVTSTPNAPIEKELGQWLERIGF